MENGYRKGRRMPAKKDRRVVLGSVAIGKPAYDRMLKNISTDPSLEYVAAHGKRATWIRAAIAEKCERQESANGK